MRSSYMSPETPFASTMPQMPSNDELKDYLDAATVAARRAAEVLAEWRFRFQVQEKGRFDLVTDADVASQKVIRAYLQGRFPTHGFLGEEDQAGHGRPGPDAPPTWIVDPVDGTTNYVHDFPFYCISIGLQIASELVVGVIYEPTRDELFHGARGLGARLGTKLLKVSNADRLEEALLVTGFPANMQQKEKLFEAWRYFSLHSQSVRRTGSTALNLAYLAAGRFDGYWAFDNHVWDVAAGAVLVREAGGMLTNADGSAYDAHTADCVASNSKIHELLLAGLKGKCP